MERSRFTDKVAMVTGGGSGLGRAFCRAFAEEGAAVVCPDINLEGARETVAEINKMGGQALAVKADGTRSDEVGEMVEEALKAYRKIDILVNNAGIVVRQGLLDTTEEVWDKETGTDLKGPFLVTKAVVPQMIPRKYGKIVNIASAAGLIGAGLIGVTRVWALEFALYRICVNSIAPGFIATPINEAWRKTPVGKKISRQVPLGFGEVSNVVSAVLFLSSSESDFITGHCLVVDGGLTCCRDFGAEYREFDKGKK